MNKPYARPTKAALAAVILSCSGVMAAATELEQDMRDSANWASTLSRPPPSPPTSRTSSAGISDRNRLGMA